MTSNDVQSISIELTQVVFYSNRADSRWIEWGRLELDLFDTDWIGLQSDVIQPDPIDLNRIGCKQIELYAAEMNLNELIKVEFDNNVTCSLRGFDQTRIELN